MSQLRDLAIKLSDAQWEGRSFDCLPMPGENEVLQVTLSDPDEIPIYLTITDTQMLCIAYLFKTDEVKAEARADFNELCLRLNISMPLSAFAKVGDQYVLFGALSATSSFDDVQRELVTLGENAVEALEAVEEYLA
jgi:uncharacterized protein YjfI (DUF2170 family)